MTKITKINLENAKDCLEMAIIAGRKDPALTNRLQTILHALNAELAS